MGSHISKTILSATRKTFGDGTQYIVDVTNPSPTDVVMEWCYALTDITGFAASSSRLDGSGGAFPTELNAGIELPSGLSDISVTSGSLLCFYK
jgi:hypothetical protein